MMSTFTHHITIPSDSDIRDAFSSTNTPDYISASPDYFSASPGNTSSDPSEDLSKYLLASLAISPFHNDPYMKVMQAYNATSNESPIPLPRAPIAPPTVLPPSPVLPLSPMFDPRDFFFPMRFCHLINELVSYHPPLLIPLPHLRFHKEQMGHNDEIVLARVKISTLEMIIEDMQAPKRTSTSAAPAMNQAAIRKLVVDSVDVALEA
nr:hypothetical protein [Tanacetum cinerariifolium]